jgi:hypothetical protein
MTTRSLDALLTAARTAPPVVSDDDVRRIVAGESIHPAGSGRQAYHPPLLITGITMTATLAVILGIIILSTPKHPVAPAGARATTDHGSAVMSDSAAPAAPAAAPGSAAAAIGSGAVSTQPAGAGPSAQRASTPIPAPDARAPRVVARNPLDALPLPPQAAARPDIDPGSMRGMMDRLVAEAPQPDPAWFPDPAATGDRDSLTAWKDSVRNYSAFYINAVYGPRSFDDLSAHLASNGYSLGSGGDFSLGMSYEFPRPDIDAPSSQVFPFYLYSARRIYAPAVSFEYLMKPAVTPVSGTRSASFSSLSLFQDNNFFITEHRNGRLALVLSWGVNWTSLTLAQNRTFDEILQLQDPGSVTMSKYYAMLRPALRYDHVLFGNIHVGLSAGYTFTLSKGTWRLRSALDMQPGILVNGGPNDSLSGFYAGFHFTMR